MGRLWSVSTDGLRLLSGTCVVYAVHSQATQVLAASLPPPSDPVQAARLRTDMVTMPFKVFETLAKHPWIRADFERFMDDREKAKPGLGEVPPSMQEA